jgi:putative MATE family efflux protein
MPFEPGVDADVEHSLVTPSERPTNDHDAQEAYVEFAGVIGQPGASTPSADLADAEVAGRLEIDRADQEAKHDEHAGETRGDLHRVVWQLAWPSVLAMMLQTVNSFMDRGFVGRLGPDALAAVGVGGQMMFVIFSLGMSISVGATALVARFTGAKEPDQARIAGNQALWIALLLSIVSIAFGLAVCHPAVQAMGLSPSATVLCEKYVRLSLIGVPGLFTMLILIGAYRGIGDTITVLLVSIVVNIIHLGGDFLLIFGSFGAPKLGLPGGAMALVTSQYIGAILYVLLLRKTALAGLVRRKTTLEVEWAKRILNVGLPAALQNLSRILSMLAFTAVLARSSDATSAVAALTIGLTSESIAFMPGFGFSVAASTLAGQNLGAKHPDRAERAAWVSLQQGLAVMCVMGIVFYVFAEQFAHIFTHDAAVVRLAVMYLRISAVAEPFLALGMILTGALNGAGDTKAPAVAGVVTMWGLRLPFAYFLAITLRYAAVGAWWSMALSTIVLGIVSYVLFKLGHWKKKEV